MIKSAWEFVKNYAVPLANEVICKYKDQAAVVLLAGIMLKLDALTESSTFGQAKWNLTAYNLTTTPQKILERDLTGKVRKVSCWLDSASGGPTPTIRVGQSATSSSGGGVRVSAGQVNEIGEVGPSVELWAASSTAIAMYVIERA